MNQFILNGKTISVFNTGKKEAIQALINGQAQDLIISGDRLEMPYGGGVYIFQVGHIGINEVTEHIRIIGSQIFLNILEDGAWEQVSSKPIQFDIPESYFPAYAGMPSLANSGILKTIFMHAINALAARLPQIGGDANGWGPELFHSDGTFKQPLFTYSKAGSSLTMNAIHGTAPFAYKVDGLEIEKQSTDDATGEPLVDAEGNPVMEPHNVAEQLAPGFHSFQVTDSLGLTEARNILV